MLEFAILSVPTTTSELDIFNKVIKFINLDVIALSAAS